MICLTTSLSERLELQAEFWLDDGSNDEASILEGAAETAPHVNDVACLSIKEAKVGRREIGVVDIAVLDIAHAHL